MVRVVGWEGADGTGDRSAEEVGHKEPQRPKSWLLVVDGVSR